MRQSDLLLAARVLVGVFVRPSAMAEGAVPKPLRVCIPVGRSSMEGRGVVDLSGKDCNDARRTTERWGQWASSPKQSGAAHRRGTAPVARSRVVRRVAGGDPVDRRISPPRPRHLPLKWQAPEGAWEPGNPIWGSRSERPHNCSD